MLNIVFDKRNPIQNFFTMCAHALCGRANALLRDGKDTYDAFKDLFRSIPDKDPDHNFLHLKNRTLLASSSPHLRVLIVHQTIRIDSLIKRSSSPQQKQHNSDDDCNRRPLPDQCLSTKIFCLVCIYPRF